MQSLTRYILHEDQDIYYLHRKKLIDMGQPQNCELRMVKNFDISFWVRLESNTVQNVEGNFVTRVVMIDISERKRSEEVLRESEKKLQTIFELVPIGLILLDSKGVVLDCNHQLSEIFGVPRENYIGKNLPDRIPEGPVRQNLVDTLADNKNHQYEGPYTSILSGKELYIHVSSKKITPDLIIAIIMDITEHKRAVNALGKSEAHLKTLVETIPDLIWLKNPDGVYLDCNAKFEHFFGAAKNEIIGRTDYDFVDRKLADFFREHDRKAMAACRPCSNEEWLTFANGGYHGFFDTIKTPMSDAGGNLIGVLGIARDVTERKVAEENIKAALQEKEVLLREIHHRVKNNMQVISSLLYLQASRVETRQAKEALLESQQRIVAMAMIHETLYGSENLAAINLSTYLKNLVHHLQRIHSNQRNIRINLDLDKIELDITHALPCSLIFNELITNAFKHAFPNERKGTVQIRLHRVVNQEVLLEVSDNGVGLSPDLDLVTPSSLGLMLVQRLLNKQLKGSMNVTSANGGATFTLHWPLLISAPRNAR